MLGQNLTVPLALSRFKLKIQTTSTSTSPTDTYLDVKLSLAKQKHTVTTTNLTMAISFPYLPIVAMLLPIFTPLAEAAIITYDFNITWVLANSDGAFVRPTIGMNGLYQS